MRSRTSIYDERSLIFDTAATAHLIRNLDLFDGAPVRIDDDDVSFVGFDTNSGHTFAVHRGTLKAPLEGIEAYYVPNCVGNIISEPRFREEFHIADIREADHLEDTMVASRKGSKSHSPSLKWSRSLEGVFTCDLRQLDRRKEPILASLSPKPLRLEETDIVVQSWLLQLGLTAREAVGTIAMSRMTRVKREETLRVCMERLSMTNHQIASALDSYKACAVIEKNADVPILDSFDEVIELLRAMKIAESDVSHKRKRGPLSGELTGLDNSKVSGPSSGELKEPTNTKASAIFSGELTEPGNSKVSIPSSGEMTGSVDFKNRVTVSFDSVSGCDTSKKNSESVSGCNTSRMPDSVSADECDNSKANLIHPILNYDKTTILTAKEIRKETLKLTDCLMALFLYQSGLTLQELMVARLSADIGMSTEPEIVALSLAQRGLSKAAIKRVADIERLHKITSFVGLETLKTMIKFRTVKELDDNLSEHDVQNYAEYVHEGDCACTEGKMKVHPKPVFDNVAHNPHSCHCDVMHLTTPDKKTKFRFLVGVDAETQFLFAYPLHDLSEISVKHAMKGIIAEYKRNPNRKLDKIVMDRAGALNSKATVDALTSLNLAYEYCTTALHVVLAEAAIKFIKSLVRTTVLDSGTKRRFLNSFVPDLVKWICQSINYSLRSGNDYASPYTRFTNKVVSAKIHYRAAFLDIVAVNANLDKASNIDSRAKICLVMARDDSERGSMNMLDIETGKLINRYHFTLVEGPTYVERVRAFLNSGKFKSIGTFQVNHEEEDEPAVDEVANSDEITVSGDTEGMSSKEVAEEDVNSDGTMVSGDAKVVQSNEEMVLSSIEENSIINEIPSEINIRTKDAFIIPIDKDGSCLFHSVAYHFEDNSGSSALELRNETVDYMLKNPDEIFGGLSIKTHILNDLFRNPDREHIENDDILYVNLPIVCM